jgi:FkbM family methyltransferase
MFTCLKKKKNYLKQVTLPNNIKVYCLEKREPKIIYEQIQEYFKHGITVKQEDIIFDIGANIGIFSLYVNFLLKNQVQIYAFEPIPATYSILELNAKRFNPERIYTFCYGLAQESKPVVFNYYPKLSIISSAYLDNPKAASNDMQKLILRNFKSAPQDARLLRFLPKFIRPIILQYFLKDSFQAESVMCQMTTISNIIDKFKIPKIDLLKIDVEQAELDVLQGINHLDWQKIKQLAIEVHDLHGRLETIQSLLKNYGFNQITIEQEPFFAGTEIYNLYAVR